MGGVAKAEAGGGMEMHMPMHMGAAVIPGVYSAARPPPPPPPPPVMLAYAPGTDFGHNRPTAVLVAEAKMLLGGRVPTTAEEQVRTCKTV